MANSRGWRVKSKTEPQSKTTALNAVDVARVAYAFYEQRGRADGHALEDWLKAEEVARQRARGR